MKNKLIAVISAFMIMLCFSVTAYADAADTTTVTPSRTISTEGTGHVVDNISDGDKLQFISVTAKDGSVFFVVIDKQNVNDNVYFLNKVDIGDLEALAKDYKAQPQTSLANTPEPSPSASPDKAEEKQKEKKDNGGSNNSLLIVLLLLAAAAGVGAYYFKVYLPKKKLASADDIEDFEFIDDESEADEDSESPDYENETYEPDDTEETE